MLNYHTFNLNFIYWYVTITYYLILNDHTNIQALPDYHLDIKPLHKMLHCKMSFSTLRHLTEK